jgi:hypothetical protein
VFNITHHYRLATLSLEAPNLRGQLKAALEELEQCTVEACDLLAQV